jgi:GntR family transcriptional regulator
MAGRKPRVRDTRKPKDGDAKVERVASYLREKIISEEWKYGDKTPSQSELVDQFGYSEETCRNGILRVAEEGMIHTSRGVSSRVIWPNPPHRLLIGTRPLTLEEPKTQFVKLAIGVGAGSVTREWSESDVEVSKWVARWLELETGATMLMRRLKLFVGGVPILMSTSFLPVGLTGGEGWRNMEVGQLALTEHAMTTTFVDDWSRMPTREEFERLNMFRGVPVLLVCRPCQVLPSPEAGSAVPAGVMIIARSDHVYICHSADGAG